MLDLDLAAFEVPLDAPWEAPGAAALDAQTLATLASTPTSTSASAARSILDVAVKAIFGTGRASSRSCSPSSTCHAGGGLTNLARTTGGAPGTALRGRLPATGRRAWPRSSGSGCVLGCARRDDRPRPRPCDLGARLVAAGAATRPTRRPGTGPSRAGRRCVFAMAPASAGAWSTHRRCRVGGTSCASACRWAPSPRSTSSTNEPFWRAQGLNGQIVAPGGVHGDRTFDDSPRRRLPRRHRRLRRRRRLPPDGGGRDREARRAAVLADLERAFGSRAGAPDRVRRAALAGRALHPGRPGRRERPRRADRAWARRCASRSAPLHWAGTETATQWCGYLDGALSAGIARRRRGAARC